MMAKNTDQKQLVKIILVNRNINKIRDISDLILYYIVYDIYCQLKCFMTEYRAELTD